MGLHTSAEIMVESSVHNCFFILVADITKSVMFASSSFPVHMNLIGDGAKLLEIVFGLTLVHHVCCCEV